MKRLGVALVVVLIEKYFFCVYLFNEKEENICRQLFPIYFLIYIGNKSTISYLHSYIHGKQINENKEN